jgi:DNA-binding response OmpR family regulator
MGGPARNSVALVDDEESIRDAVGFALEEAGYTVRTFADGQAAWEAFQQDLPELVVLDILMPRMDGLELCRKLRSVSEALPIIFLTSRDEEFDRVLGLELGADDYLCKPFSMRELLARVKVLFRRLALAKVTEREPEDMLRRGSLELDLQRYLTRWNTAAVSLTVTEFMLLRALAKHPGHVRTRRQLMEEGYPYDAYVSERTIDTHIKRLRQKFARVDPTFAAIETVHGLGYRYRVDAEGE